MILVQTLVKDLFNMKKKIFFSGFLLMTMFCGCMTQNEITSSIAELETVEKSVNDTLFLQNPQVFCLETKDNALIKLYRANLQIPFLCNLTVPTFLSSLLYFH